MAGNQNSNNYQNLKPFLKDFVGSKVSLSENDRQTNVRIVKDTVERFIQRMKDVDPLFKEVFQNIYYAGSYYDGLKVSEANEFDLNIRLKMPFKPENFQAVHNGVPNGYVMYKLNQPLELLLARHPKWDLYKQLDKLMDETHTMLSQKKINSWCLGVVDKTFSEYGSEFRNVSRSTSGPAKTLNIRSSINGTMLDVDLVPVVELPQFPGSVRQSAHLKTLPDTKKTCFIVPKPPPAHIASLKNSDNFFRVSMPDAERHLMENKGCVKMLIKIFKVLRDTENWRFLVSYHIKTVFMHQLEKHPDAEFWKEDKAGELFILMLQQFIAVMDKKTLAHIYFPNCNLLANVPQVTLTNTKGRFETILKMATTDVAKLRAKYIPSSR